ncbi:MAG: gliding motility-associated peptidyl-prolyl isomerase GldI, partial [Allomuricauda sp.]
MKAIWSSILILVLMSCGGPEPRKPVKVKSGSFFKESVERNKALLAQEETIIQKIIERDTLHEYMASPSGFWYYFDTKNDSSRYLPKTNDQILFSYDLRSLNNDTIYTAQEIGPTSYVVDKE